MAVKQSNTTTGIRNITIAHATVQALHMLKEDASGSSRTVRSAKQCSTRDCPKKKHPWSAVDMTSRMTSPVRSPCANFGSEVTMTLATTDSHWHIIPWCSDDILQDLPSDSKKWPPAITFCQVTSQRAVFSAKTTKSLGRKNKVPDFRLEGRWSTAVPFGLWKCIVSFLWTCWKTHHRPISILGLGWSSSVWPFSVFKMPNWILSLSHCQEQFIVTVISVWKHPQSQLSPIKMLLLQRLS